MFYMSVLYGFIPEYLKKSVYASRNGERFRMFFHGSLRFYETSQCYISQFSGITRI